ncbi:hypothetical protein JNB_07589 [Janibacter sp. HTCC2649]|uniref:hypothetical protein n=1 Tax=Janibacter sp. HTCC2649 TaxID=313589 RepID=UPI0000670C14|nr:hypothetical protein [Janibacter sp. HTCC2649]EAQ00015.1 hypothetical protein JNB_07589 [Janibacter sp. HTCC2649]
MGKREDAEGVWIGNQDFGSRRWAAVAFLSFLVVAAVGSAFMAVKSDVPISATGGVLLCLGSAGFFVPAALLGRHRSPGIRLAGTCVLVIGFALVMWTFAGQVEPTFFDGRRGPMIRVGSPFGAVFFLAVGGYLLRKSFRRIEPTDYDSRHAERD